jgi:hypothetical protein
MHQPMDRGYWALVPKRALCSSLSLAGAPGEGKLIGRHPAADRKVKRRSYPDHFRPLASGHPRTIFAPFCAPLVYLERRAAASVHPQVSNTLARLQRITRQAIRGRFLLHFVHPWFTSNVVWGARKCAFSGAGRKPMSKSSRRN